MNERIREDFDGRIPTRAKYVMAAAAGVTQSFMGVDMKILHTKGAMILGLALGGAISLSPIWFGIWSFYEKDIENGMLFILIAIAIIAMGLFAGLRIYCTHWIRYGNGSIVVRRVSKIQVNGRPAGKWKIREDRFMLEELAAYGFSRIILHRSVEYHYSSGRSLELECFFKLKNGKMIGFEVGYYMWKDMEELFDYITEETGLEFQPPERLAAIRGRKGMRKNRGVD